MRYAEPGSPGSLVAVEERYDNFVGGKWMPPSHGDYGVDLAPATGRPICEVAWSTPADVETALDAAHLAARDWNRSSRAERCAVLEAIADAIEAHGEMLAVAESWESGKPIRETLRVDLPLTIDHFRYFAAAARSAEERLTTIDAQTTAYHLREPLGVVAQIIGFTFPLLTAAWKLAPALAAGNCVVLKPSSSTPWSILKLMEVIEDALPPGVVNVVTGSGATLGKALATSPRIAAIQQGDPLDLATMLGPQVSRPLLDQIAEYVDIGRREGAAVLIGGRRAHLGGEVEDGYFFEPTVLYGTPDLRIFHEEIVGPVLAVTTFTGEADALRLANDSLYGLGAGVWTRDGARQMRMAQGLQSGAVWVNCYHQYPAGSGLGGCTISGIGRENHQHTLEQYSRTKDVLVSTDEKRLGFF